MDAARPTDQDEVSVHASYIREARAAINAIVPAASDVTNLTVPAGTTALSVSVNLSSSYFEVVFIQGSGAAIIANIWGGIDGQIKIFVFMNSVMSIRDGLKAAGAIYLNQLPALTLFNAQENDVLALVNVGGDGSTNFGYWKEIFRQQAVK